MTEESDWTDETGEDDDDMEYEPTTEEDGEDMRDIFQLLQEEEGVDDDGNEEYHGMKLYGSCSFHVLIMIRCRTGLYDDRVRH